MSAGRSSLGQCPEAGIHESSLQDMGSSDNEEQSDVENDGTFQFRSLFSVFIS